MGSLESVPAREKSRVAGILSHGCVSFFDYCAHNVHTHVRIPHGKSTDSALAGWLTEIRDFAATQGVPRSGGGGKRGDQ